MLSLLKVFYLTIIRLHVKSPRGLITFCTTLASFETNDQTFNVIAASTRSPCGPNDACALKSRPDLRFSDAKICDLGDIMLPIPYIDHENPRMMFTMHDADPIKALSIIEISQVSICFTGPCTIETKQTVNGLEVTLLAISESAYRLLVEKDERSGLLEANQQKKEVFHLPSFGEVDIKLKCNRKEVAKRLSFSKEEFCRIKSGWTKRFGFSYCMHPELVHLSLALVTSAVVLHLLRHIWNVLVALIVISGYTGFRLLLFCFRCKNCSCYRFISHKCCEKCYFCGIPLREGGNHMRVCTGFLDKGYTRLISEAVSLSLTKKVSLFFSRYFSPLLTASLILAAFVNFPLASGAKGSELNYEIRLNRLIEEEGFIELKALPRISNIKSVPISLDSEKVKCASGNCQVD